MNTLSDDRIIEIAKRVAAANLAQSWTRMVSAAATTDALGRDALEVTFGVTPGSSVTGDMAVNTVFDLNQKLQEEGEERFSTVRYSSE
jgi:hypothetical protein